MTAVMLILGLNLGNCLVQLFQPTPDWGVAFDRSFFQTLAVIAYVLLDKWMAA